MKSISYHCPICYFPHIYRPRDSFKEIKIRHTRCRHTQIPVTITDKDGKYRVIWSEL